MKGYKLDRKKADILFLKTTGAKVSDTLAPALDCFLDWSYQCYKQGINGEKFKPCIPAIETDIDDEV